MVYLLNDTGNIRSSLFQHSIWYKDSKPSFFN